MMMESSEQLPFDSLDPDDSSSEAESVDEDCASHEDVLLNQNDDRANEEIPELIDNPALILNDSERFILSGGDLTFAQNAENNMIVLFNNTERPLSQGHSVNSDNIPASPVIKNDGLQNNDKNRTSFIEQENGGLDNSHCSSESVVQKEATTQLVFIADSTRVRRLNANSGLIELNGTFLPATVISKPCKKNEAGSASEGSVIVSPTYVDSYPNKMEDGVSATNKENNNSLHEENIASVAETSSPRMEENLFMPPRDIDLAVSAIHTAFPTLDHDWRAKNILEYKKQTEETGQSKLALDAMSPNVNYFEYSNLKESLDSELFSKSPLIEESSNCSDLKGGSDFSNGDDNTNLKTSIVEETVKEDNNEPIHFPLQLQSSETILKDDSKSSLDFDQSQNLDNKIFYPSSKKYENEMDYTNSEETCSEIQTCTKGTFLSLKDNTKLKRLFFSDNSQPKDRNLHLLKKMKSVHPSKVKGMDVYDFETGSSNLDPELSDNSSLDRQLCNSVNPDEVDTTKDIQLVNSNLEGVSGNLTFQGILTPFSDNSKHNENLTDGKNGETYYDNPQYSLDQEINHSNENNICYENSLSVKNGVNINKSKQDNSVGAILAEFDGIPVVKPPQRTYARKKKTTDSVGNIEFCDDFYGDVLNPTSKILNLDDEKETNSIDEYDLPDEDGYVNLIPSNIKTRVSSFPVDESTISLRSESSDKNLLEEIPDIIIGAEESIRENTCCGMNIDNESKENDSIFSNIAASDKLTVKPPQRTYARKKKTYDCSKDIGLFSDCRDSEHNSTPKAFCLDDEKEQIVIDEYCSADEDGYVNLMPSNRKCIVNTYPVDESVISLGPETSDQTLEEIADFDIDSTDSGNICYGTYLMQTSFKPTNAKKAEKDASNASSPDFPKLASPRPSPKKKIQTLSFEKISSIDSYKNGQLCDEDIMSSSIEMKNESFDKRKTGRKVKRKIKKTLGSSKNHRCSSIAVVHKRCQPSKDNVKHGRNLHSTSLENANTYGIRFVNDYSTEKNNCVNDEFSTPSTSTQELDNFQYSCPHCNFVSNRVNNLIAHLKYCPCKPSSNMKKQWSHPLFSGSLFSSQNISKGSVIHNRSAANFPTTSEVLHMTSDGRLNKPQCECHCQSQCPQSHITISN